MMSKICTKTGMRMVQILAYGCLFSWHMVIGQAQSLDEVIAKHIAATGGEKRWREIKSVQETYYEEGVFATDLEHTEDKKQHKIKNVESTVQDVGLRVDVYMADPNNPNSDSTALQNIASMVISPYTGGWFIQGEGDPVALPDIMYQLSLSKVDLQPLLMDYAKKGREFKLKKKKKKINKEPCYVIEGRMKAGVELDIKMYISTKNYYLLKSSYSASDPELGLSIFVETTYTDFRDVEGYIYPFKRTEKINYGPEQPEQKKVTTVEQIAINVPIDEDIFSPE